MFGLDKLPEDTGNGIIVGPGVQGDIGIVDMKRSGGGHVVKKGGKEMSIVSRLAALFMLQWCCHVRFLISFCLLMFIAQPVM